MSLNRKRFEKQNAHSNNDVVIYPAINTTRRSPKFAALLESHKARLDQAVLVNQVGRIGKLGRVKSKRTKKVEEIENNHESSRAASLAAIRTRQTQARERLNTRRRSRTATSRNVKAAKIEKEPTAAAAELNYLSTLAEPIDYEKAVAAGITPNAPSHDKQVDVARQWLTKKGQKGVLRLISGGKRAVETVTGDEFLNVNRLVGLLAKLKVDNPKRLLLTISVEIDRIQTKAFMSWVFDDATGTRTT